MSSAEATAQTFGFADVEESYRSVSDGVESGSCGDIGKVSLQAFAMLEGLKGEGIEDAIGFLGKVGHGWDSIGWVIAIVLRGEGCRGDRPTTNRS